MKHYLSKSKSLAAFQETLRKEKSSFLVAGLFPSAKALLISEMQKSLAKPVLLLTGAAKNDAWFSNLSFFQEEAPLEFPAWEALPGEKLSPSFDVMGKRIASLHSLRQKKTSFLLSPLTSVLQKLPPQKEWESHFYHWKVKEEIPFDWIAPLLIKLGYKKNKLVTDKGEFAVRGGIIDLFPPSSFSPFRIEFFGDEIESIRVFDTGSQKSLEKVKELKFAIASEKDFLEKAETFSSIFDFFATEPLVVLDNLVALEDAYTSFHSLPMAKSKYFYPMEEFLQKIHPLQKVFFTETSVDSLFPCKKEKRELYFQPLSFEYFSQNFFAKEYFAPFSSVETFFSTPLQENASLLDQIASPSTPKMELSFVLEKKEEPLRQSLEQKKITSFSLYKGYLSQGLVITDVPAAIIAETDLTHTQRFRREKWRNLASAPTAEFHQLLPGDYVVHFHSGIGKYLGCEKQTNHQGNESEFLVIEYAEKSKLYVPLSQSYLVSKYIGTHESTPTLHALGTKKWQQVKTKAEKQIVGYASDLLHLYAERQVEERLPLLHDSDEMKDFEDSFPYEETEDQLKAIEDIKKDFSENKPMDRLVLGDVGFGKTEVAIRAAFKMVLEGKKQVAVLVPTTVLALQHFDSFRERLQSYPLQVEVLSRTHSPKKNREILQNTAEGKVDILIGTHRLLSKDVTFKDLGLVIIDEEQRFGVKAKEHLKTLKKGVDCLTLSATPIPRTLYMSLIQIRHMSVINTPPHDRLPVQTILAQNEDSVIQSALLRELSREGQAFFIHNRVESIHTRASHIQKLVPQAKIGLVHGQMDPEAVDAIFHKFKQGEIDILFATSIVENGIDVPNANTIIIDRADRFGLADLYQLRGRVGRWNRSAFAYFLTPPKMEEPARKRLSIFLETGGYGGGLKIAMRDLEIRGAGDLLGTEQSGQVAAIGFHLYCKLLKRAISSLQKEVPSPFMETHIDFPFPAKIPEDYIDEPSLRMEIYHRLGEATTYQETEHLREELKDRFGPLPNPVIWLYHMTRIRLLAYYNQFAKVKFTDSFFLLTREKEETKKFLYPKGADPDLLEKFFIEILQKNYPKVKYPKSEETHMSQLPTNDIKPGMKLEIDKDPYVVVSNEFVKPGKGQAFNRIRVKNLLTSRVVEKTFKSGEKLLLADVEERQMRFLYQDGDSGVFMDEENFEQLNIPHTVIQNNLIWLKEDLVYEVIFYKGSAIDILPPTFMELQVTETAPGVRGDTASGRVLKPAVVETGAKVQVPIFIEEGEKIKVDTRNGEYVSRV